MTVEQIIEAYCAFVRHANPQWVEIKYDAWFEWTETGYEAFVAFIADCEREIEAVTGKKGYIHPGPKQHAEDAEPWADVRPDDIYISDDNRCCGGCCDGY